MKETKIDVNEFLEFIKEIDERGEIKWVSTNASNQFSGICEGFYKGKTHKLMFLLDKYSNPKETIQFKIVDNSNANRVYSSEIQNDSAEKETYQKLLKIYQSAQLKAPYKFLNDLEIDPAREALQFLKKKVSSFSSSPSKDETNVQKIENKPIQ